MTDRELRIDGDRWRVRLSRTSAGPGLQALVFFPVTCDQRPYRVVEVPKERVPGTEALASLSEEELKELYREGSSMGFPRSYA